MAQTEGAGHVTYFDEIKANPAEEQHRYVVGGICVAMEHIPEIEGKLNELAMKTFGTTELTPQTEFHASHIYFGKGAFKGRPVADRIAVLEEIGLLLSDGDKIKRVNATVHTDRLGSPDRAAEFAFLFFCERVQLLIGNESYTLMIGDQDDGETKNMIRDFLRYRARGTPWDHGIQISNIVDSVHFCRSHHSRMIQLADVYLFLSSHGYGTRTGWPAEQLTKSLGKCNLFAHRYKVWPPA